MFALAYLSQMLFITCISYICSCYVYMFFSLAILSVSNKTGLLQFAERLHKLGIDLIASGGTARKIRESGIEVRYSHILLLLLLYQILPKIALLEMLVMLLVHKRCLEVE